MLWYIALMLLIIFIYLKIYIPHQYWKNKNVQQIEPTPIIGNVKDFLTGKKNAAETMVEIYNSFEDARYIGTYIFLKPMLLIKDINLVKQIFVKDFENFVDRNYSGINDDIEPLFGRCLFFLRGQKWRDMRSTLSPAFTSSKMRSLFILITECAKNVVNHYEKFIDANNLIVLEMKDVTSRYANDVIGSCAFGLDCDSFKERDNEFYKMGKRTTHLTGGKGIKFIGFLLSPDFMQYFNITLFNEDENNYFRNLVRSMMAYREKEAIIKPDMIHQLMEAKKGNLRHDAYSAKNTDGFAVVEESEVGRKRVEKTEFTDDDLIAQTVLFFAAGFDTSSTLLSFLAYDLAINEDVQRKLLNEIDETLEACNEEITYEVITKMKYLDMVVCESLRLWPPGIAVDRKCLKPYFIKPENPNEVPLVLDEGSVVWLPIYAIHMDPKYWPNPHKYDPERFNDENKKNILPFTFIPFGVGPRSCVGSRFAILEVKVLYVNLLKKFEIVVVEKTQIPMKFPKRYFGMDAEKGFWIGLKLRQKNV